MPIERVLEPEVMDTPEEARDYNAMDHAEVNARFVDDFLDVHGRCRGGSILDVGTGTALIPIELCRRDAKARVVAIDLADHMLRLGALNVANAGFGDRIRLRKADAKSAAGESGEGFEAVVSNSIVHHIPEPTMVLDAMIRQVGPDGTLFVRDLARPSTREELNRLVDLYANDAPPKARGLFADSLHAALTVDEVKALLVSLGLTDPDVRITSDRHWTWISKGQRA